GLAEYLQLHFGPVFLLLFYFRSSSICQGIPRPRSAFVQTAACACQQPGERAPDSVTCDVAEVVLRVR
ncbi:MAG: hypothetical protein ACPIOQ_45470, partial [Promethearchaeia archaeon]